jgi:SAM-dependent methyltransferase
VPTVAEIFTWRGLRTLPSRARRRLSAEVRRAAALSVVRFPWVKPHLQRLSFEISLLVADDDPGVYGASYYGARRNPSSREGASGYERYDRASSHSNEAAFLLWSHFEARRTLDVGCAFGFTVEALRELGVDAKGCDFSAFAVNHAPASVRNHVFFGDLSQTLPFGDRSFDVVSAFETLEHLPPALVPHALSELFRVTRGFLVATIPSFGPNEHGPAGWFEGKVRESMLTQYKSLGPDYAGPVPEEDLARDVCGRPLEGHLTIASFAWWRARFTEAGFVHSPDMERRLYRDIDRFGLVGAWNLYVLRRPEVELPPRQVRSPSEILKVERDWRLPRPRSAGASR